MKKVEVENVLQEFFPRFWKGDYISHRNTNKQGGTLIETKEWHNRIVQYSYNERGAILCCLVIITATLGLNRTSCKEVKSLDELKKRLFNTL